MFFNFGNLLHVLLRISLCELVCLFPYFILQTRSLLLPVLQHWPTMSSLSTTILLLLLTFVAFPTLTSAQCIVTVAGPLSIEGSPATTQQIANPYGISVDETNGGYVLSDASGHTLRHIWPNGTMTTILGVWRASGLASDGPVSSTTLLSSPTSVITDKAGGYYFCDRGNFVVKRLFANGTMVRVAGNATGRFVADDGPATSTPLLAPTFLSLDSTGGLWISDQGK